ncbi:MAG: hypothetical protein I8H71_15040 [Xanthomonadaceae bacterium]|nr:hypothetical protein [Xanthomonadaceae bacterium]
MPNQPLAGKLNARDKMTGNHSIQKEELNPSERIREAIGEESVASFSRRCDIGDSTIRKYLDGSLPNSVNLVAIADTANVNIEWLATGRGSKMRGSASNVEELAAARAINLRNAIAHGLNPSHPSSSINIDDVARLTLAIEAVEEGLDGAYRTLPPEKRAKLIAAAYDLLIDMEQKDNVVKFIKLAA